MSTLSQSQASTTSSFQHHHQHPIYTISSSASRPTRPTAPSPRDPTIRHAGRAHIRGKIRRVWRPRYLELCDSGLVRYYELPPTADVTLPEDSDWDHVNMIPKDTLVIYHARIIDVTTLRDLHVGLPKGSFGFLFRGQRQNCHLELMRGPAAQEPNPPREYFCAVSTLEEAQTWVIVLQWAASVCKAAHQRSLSFSSSVSRGSLSDAPHGGGGMGGSSNINFLGDSCHIPVGARIPSVLDNAGRYIVSSPDGASFGTFDFDESFLDANPSTSRHSLFRDMAQHNYDDASGRDTNNRRTAGRIVVTKVYGYRLVKMPSSRLGAALLQWEVAYEIALLILQVPKVEERRILRTAQDLESLLHDLKEELDSRISLTVVEEWQTKLDTAENKLPGVLTSTPLPTTIATTTTTTTTEKNTNNNMTLSSIVASFSFVDQMLRALAMDANIVNSRAMRQCFVLDTPNPTVAPHYWWKSPLRSSITFQRTLTVSEDETDLFVKSWLSSQQRSANQALSLAAASSQFSFSPMWLWMLQRPWMILGGAGVGLALSIPVARIYQQAMVSVTVRLDVLMGSWCAAALLGKEYLADKARSKSHPKSSTGTRRRPYSSPRHFDMHDAATTATSTNSKLHSTVVVSVPSMGHEIDLDASSSVDSKDDLDYVEQDDEADAASVLVSKLSSPLPQYPQNHGESCWSIPSDNRIFRVRGHTYLEDRIKIPSGPSPFTCRGVDVWLTDNPERHIARHPSVLNGKLHEQDTFLVNFLLPFGNFVSYFTVPPVSQFPNEKLGTVWTRFLKGDQQYRDKRLKLLPIVIDGPWIVKAAVGNGTAPALLGKVIPLQYFFQEPNPETKTKGIYEVDVIITASSIAKGILSVVKGHTKSLTIAFAFIIEAAEREELPESVLCSFQVHSLHLEDCPHLPECNLDEI